MNQELEAIKIRIRSAALKTVDRNCTEAESESAMAFVGKMLSQYNLTMSEIEITEEKCISKTIQTSNKAKGAIDSCIMGIAHFTDCICYFDRVYENGKKVRIDYIFYGHETDVLMAEHIYNLVEVSMDNETNEFKKTDDYLFPSSYDRNGNLRPRKTAFVSFQRGFAHRIYERLVKMKKEQTIQMQKHWTSGRDLVLYKKQIVEDEFKKSGFRIGKAKKGASYRGDAYYQGREKGEKVNLNRPLDNQRNKLMLS